MQFDELTVEVREFCERRDWGQYHTPKDLAIGLVTESSELLELFRFKDQTEQSELLTESGKREEVEEELADILFFLLRYADLYDIDLESALERKLEKNRGDIRRTNIKVATRSTTNSEDARLRKHKIWIPGGYLIRSIGPGDQTGVRIEGVRNRESERGSLMGELIPVHVQGLERK